MNSKQLAQSILAKIQATKLASNTLAQPIAVHSNESYGTNAERNTLRLHIAAYYIMRREVTSRDYIRYCNSLVGRECILGYGSSRPILPRLLGLIPFGIQTNIELWEATQHIFYSFTLEEQKEICTIIYTNYGEITYD